MGRFVLKGNSTRSETINFITEPTVADKMYEAMQEIK